MIWKKIAPAVAESGGRITQDALKNLLLKFEYQAWTVFEDKRCLATVVTKINVYPSGLKSLDAIFAAGDDRAKWQTLVVETLKKFARAEGCEMFEIAGRPGWERIYPEFKKTHVVLEYRLNE